MQYPHWLMVAGAVLVAIGFIGLAFRRNRDGERDHEPTEVTANGKQSETPTPPPFPLARPILMLGRRTEFPPPSE